MHKETLIQLYQQLTYEEKLMFYELLLTLEQNSKA